MKTIKSYNLRMKIKQLVIFTILNYISVRKYLHNFKKNWIIWSMIFSYITFITKFNQKKYQKEKYTFAPQIARKLVMAGQAGTRTTLTKTSYHVNL